jgi:hypothetical protein
VIDFLSEYEQYGKGRLSVEIYDPKPDSEEEEWAIKYGMKGISLPTGEQVYLGLVALAADQEAAIAFIDPTQETRLEYDLTRIIARVQTADRMKIAVFSSLPVFGTVQGSMGMTGPRSGSEPWFFIQELAKTYDLIKVAARCRQHRSNGGSAGAVSPQKHVRHACFCRGPIHSGRRQRHCLCRPPFPDGRSAHGAWRLDPRSAVQGMGHHHGYGKGRGRFHLPHTAEEPQQPGRDQPAVAFGPAGAFSTRTT